MGVDAGRVEDRSLELEFDVVNGGSAEFSRGSSAIIMANVQMPAVTSTAKGACCQPRAFHRQHSKLLRQFRFGSDRSGFRHFSCNYSAAWLSSPSQGDLSCVKLGRLPTEVAPQIKAQVGIPQTSFVQGSAWLDSRSRPCCSTDLCPSACLELGHD